MQFCAARPPGHPSRTAIRAGCSSARADRWRAGWVLDQRSRGIERGVNAQHGRQLFVIDANQRGGRFRGIFGIGGDRGDRLAEELRLAHREHWPICTHGTVPRHWLGEVRRGHDAPHDLRHARRRRYRCQDPRPGAVQVHELHVQHVVDVDIRRVLLGPGHALDAAGASHRAADPGRLHQRSRRAADATAPMMRL